MTLKQKLTETSNDEPPKTNEYSNPNPAQKVRKSLRSTYRMPESLISKPQPGECEPDRYDLYKQHPSIDYLKEKYEMYLEWLIEQTEHSEQLDCHLNWYNYEKSINVNNDKTLWFLRNAKKSDLSSSQDSQIDFTNKLSPHNNNNIEHNIRDLIKGHKQYHSSMSFYNTDSDHHIGLKLNSKRRFSFNNQENTSFNKQQVVGLKLKGTCQENKNNSNSNCNKSNYKKLTTLIKSKNTSSVLNSNKGVQFETATKNRKLSNVKPRLSIVKPILKFNSDYFSIPLSDGCGSISSTDSAAEPISSKSLKLPPIVRCSDDFYAVLKDLEQEEQMNF